MMDNFFVATVIVVCLSAFLAVGVVAILCKTCAYCSRIKLCCESDDDRISLEENAPLVRQLATSQLLDQL